MKASVTSSLSAMLEKFPSLRVLMAFTSPESPVIVPGQLSAIEKAASLKLRN